MVWRVDVGMSSGVLNAMPQVCTKVSLHILSAWSTAPSARLPLLHAMAAQQHVCHVCTAAQHDTKQSGSAVLALSWMLIRCAYSGNRSQSATPCLQALEIGAKDGSQEPDIKVLGNAAGPQLPHMAASGNPFVARSFGSVGAVSRL